MITFDNGFWYFVGRWYFVGCSYFLVFCTVRTLLVIFLIWVPLIIVIRDLLLLLPLFFYDCYNLLWHFFHDLLHHFSIILISILNRIYQHSKSIISLHVLVSILLLVLASILLLIKVLSIKLTRKNLPFYSLFHIHLNRLIWLKTWHANLIGNNITTL